MRSLAFLVALLCPLSALAQQLPGTAARNERRPSSRHARRHRPLSDGETAASVAKRKDYWKPDYSSAEAYAKSVEPNRERLRKIIGAVDQRVPLRRWNISPAQIKARSSRRRKRYTVYAVRWPVLPGVYGEGLLLEPKGKPKASVVAIPDADQTPEMVVGLIQGVAAKGQFARHLCEQGCRVVVPR